MTFLVKYAYHVLLLLVIITIAVGTTFYHLVEGWSLIDSYYFSVVTLVTVGYGDIYPQTDFGKIFSTFYMLVGIGIIGAFVSAVIKRGAERVAVHIRDNHHKEHHLFHHYHDDYEG